MPAVPQRILPPPPPGFVCWEELMAEALDEARIAGTAGEVPVGALLVSGQGRILAKAGNAVERLRDPTAHAEMRVLREASYRTGSSRLGDCVLVSTLEPCLMCAGALVLARPAGIVYGAADPEAGAVDSRLDVLDMPFLKCAIWRLGAVSEEECSALLKNFFRARR
ncbi:MAG: nucleoside deaminase [Desulfovibrio sp.]|jgi:tRNA(adenine34) deaminase|nr:nucleoside deaminase [Desulfovibrio sp.]